MSGIKTTEVILLTSNSKELEYTSQGGKPSMFFKHFERLLSYLDYAKRFFDNASLKAPIHILIDYNQLNHMDPLVAKKMVQEREPKAVVVFIGTNTKVTSSSDHKPTT